VQTFVNVVHEHHNVEDEVAFPFYKVRMPDVPFDEFARAHNAIEKVLEDMHTPIDSLAAGTEVPMAAKRLHELLKQLAELWHPHIRSEETSISQERVDAVARVEELVSLSAEIAKYNQEHTQTLELAIPFLLYNLEPGDRAIFLQSIPKFLIDDLVPGEWKEKWEPMKPFLLD
jgi:hypothetical protein